MGIYCIRQHACCPPGFGIVHQVNLEYLGRVVFNHGGMLYPDSVVGIDSHTTMIDGLGVAGWGVGGIEAEVVVLGQAEVSQRLTNVKERANSSTVVHSHEDLARKLQGEDPYSNFLAQ